VRIPCAWLPATTPALSAAIARRAHADIGLYELSTNSSPRIDEYLRAVGSPLKSAWCAASAAAWFRESGAETPPKDAGSCDAWMAWAKETRRWSSAPVVGAAVLYGSVTDALHMGVVIRTAPVLLSVEGNTAIDKYSREGKVVDLKKIETWRVVGYVHPVPLP
jgi:hypothetical protein